MTVKELVDCIPSPPDVISNVPPFMVISPKASSSSDAFIPSPLLVTMLNVPELITILFSLLIPLSAASMFKTVFSTVNKLFDFIPFFRLRLY